MGDGLEELLVPDAAGWRSWLLAHHEASPGVWLVLHKKGGAVTGLSYADAVEEALCFGWIDGQARRRDEGSSSIRMTRRRPRSPWSPSNVQRVERLERDGRMHEAGRAAVRSAQADGRWATATAPAPDTTGTTGPAARQGTTGPAARQGATGSAARPGATGPAPLGG